MIIIVKTAWLSSVRTMAPKRDNNHPLEFQRIRFSLFVFEPLDGNNHADAGSGDFVNKASNHKEK